MTKEQLEQAIDLRNEISQLEKEINKIKRTKKQDKVSGSLSEFPYTKTNITVQGYNDASNCETRCKELKVKQKLQRLNVLLLEIEEWVKTLDNSRIRQIITYKYYDGLTWDEVAAKMGYRYSADGCRMAVKRYMKKI